MSKIKLALVIDTIDPDIGGTEKQIFLLLKHIDRTKFTPYLCCLYNSPWLEQHSDLCDIHIINFTSYRFPRSYCHLLQFAHFLRHEQIDIVQTFFRDGNIVGTIAAKLAGAKIIISSRRNLGLWNTKPYLLLLRLLNPLATRFYANSQSVANHTIAQENIAPDKIEVIYNGIEWSAFDNTTDLTPGTIRKELNIQPDEMVITAVSNLRAVKGVETVIRAAEKVHCTYPNIRLLLVGEGGDRNFLEELAERLGIGDKVFFLGSRNDVPKILKDSDIGVLGSLSEGLSNALIECMAAGLPIVCTSVGGNLELVEDTVNGFLVPPNNPELFADALKKILAAPDLKQRMGEKSYCKARTTFNIAYCVKQTENLYERLVR